MAWLLGSAALVGAAASLRPPGAAPTTPAPTTPAPSPRPTGTAPVPTDPVPPRLTDADLLVYGAAAVILVVVGYLVSLRLHPNTACNRCKGKGKHRGAIYTYANRQCTACGGKGTKPRFGRRIFFRPKT